MKYVCNPARTALLPALALTLLLAACGGGGGSGGDNGTAGGGDGNSQGSNGGGSGSGTGTGTGTGTGDGSGSGDGGAQLKVYDYWINGSQLRSLVRGDNTAQPVSLGTYSNKTHFWLYTRQTKFGADLELDVRNSVLLFIANNRFYRLATSGSSQPQPVQVSSESAANGICDWHDPVLYTPDNNNARFKYRLPGTDGQCSTADDQYREIRIGMAAADVPLSIDKDRFRADEVFTADGQLAGHLVARSGGGIFWYDSNFANPRQIASGSVSADSYSDFLLLANSPDGRYRLLQLFTSGIYVLDIATQQLTRVIDSGGSNVALGYFDGRFYVYRSTSGSNGRSILQMPMDGSAAAAELVGGLAGGAGMAGQYLVYPKVNGSNMEVYSLDLAAAGTGAKLIKSLGLSDQITVGNGRVYYRMLPASSSGTSTAGSLKVDGSDDVSFDNALWVGVGFHNGTQPAQPGLQADYLYLAQGASFGSGGAWQGGALSWVEASTGRIGGSLGAMPAGISNFAFVSTLYAGMGLGIGYSGEGSAQKTVYLRADHVTGKVTQVDQSPVDWGYSWKSDWSAAQ